MDPNMEVIVWLVILIIMIVIELATVGLATIWFAGGALVALIAAALSAPIWLQVVLFLAVSIVLLIFTRPFAVKYLNKDKISTNVDAMIGKKAVVTIPINNLKEEGQVVVNGIEWMARSESDKIEIGENEIVTVVAVSGVKLIVVPTGKKEE